MQRAATGRMLTAVTSSMRAWESWMPKKRACAVWWRSRRMMTCREITPRESAQRTERLACGVTGVGALEGSDSSKLEVRLSAGGLVALVKDAAA